VHIDHNPLLGKLGDAGCHVDLEKQRAWITGSLVDESLASAPSRAELWDLAGDACSILEGDAVHFTPGSTAVKLLDERERVMRRATVDDVLRYCRLVEQLPHIDFSSTALVPDDVPDQIGDSVRLYALLKLTGKPIVTGAFTVGGMDVMLDLQLAVRGTREELAAKPFAMFSCAPTSPLKWSHPIADNLKVCAEHCIPAELIAMPLAGLAAPVTLEGALIQHTAEALSGVVISQISRPGAPVVYGGSAGTMDMRTMTSALASLEVQMISCAYAEIGKHLGLPTQAYVGLSDSKRLDAQAGFESGTGAYLAALSGINSVSGPGMLCFENCLSLEKLLFDNELCGFAKRLKRGIEAQDAGDLPGVFEELIREETLIGSDHTARHFRDEHYMPGPTIDRRGGDDVPPADLVDRALTEVDDRVSTYTPPSVIGEDQIREMEAVMQRAAGDYQLTF
ncbi:MAG: trimethylamine methyltransferase family protein, partial [Gemmatimonadota bacterium]